MSESLSHIEHDKWLELDLEQELIAEFRKVWEQRHKTHLGFSIRTKIEEIREMRKNRDRFPEKFAVAHKGYIFYRNQAWDIKRELGAFEINELDDHFSLALRKNDFRKATGFMNDLRKLLVTDFYKEVDIDVSLVMSMYADLGISLFGDKGKAEKEELKKFKRNWD